MIRSVMIIIIIPPTHILELLRSIARSSTPNPGSTMVVGVWDVKSWMEPFLNMKGHSRYVPNIQTIRYTIQMMTSFQS